MKYEEFLAFWLETLYLFKDTEETDFHDKTPIRLKSVSIQNSIKQQIDAFPSKNELSPVPVKTESFTCEFCSYSFKAKSSWKAHIACQHMGKKRSIRCNICKKGFRGTEKYKEHVNQGYIYSLPRSSLIAITFGILGKLSCFQILKYL